MHNVSPLVRCSCITQRRDRDFYRREQTRGKVQTVFLLSRICLYRMYSIVLVAYFIFYFTA